MSLSDKFQSLLDRAKGLLSSAPPAADHTDAVHQDRFDQRLFDELMADAPALREVVEDMRQTIDYAPDLMRDTLMQLWQGDPRLRPQSEMKDTHLINHAVAHDVATSEALLQARAYTQHDKYGAAMAAIGLSTEVREYVREHNERLQEAAEEAERQKEEAEAAAQQAQAVQQAMQDALDAIPPDPPDPTPPDPTGDEEADAAAAQAAADAAAAAAEAQAQAQAQAEEAAQALESAVSAAEAAKQAAENAQTQVRAVATQARQDLKQPTQRALKEAAETLEEEAAMFDAWGIDAGEVKSMDFSERQRLAQSLRGSKLARYIDLVGRFRLMAAAQRVRKVEYGRDQVVGTELSGDLSRVVMTEFTALAMGDDELGELLELDFYKRWFEDQLLSREFEGTEKVGKGAIIAVWDESSSMDAHDGTCLRCGGTDVSTHYSNKGQCQRDGCGGYAGTREAWAKAFALALLDAARQQRRDFVGIGFASAHQQVVWRFPGGRGETADVLRMVEHFFSGTTNFPNPMDMAVDILDAEFNERGHMKGDIVFITDDASTLPSEWLSRYLRRKERLGFRTFGIALGGANPRGALAAMSDNVRTIKQFADPSAVDDVFQVL